MNIMYGSGIVLSIAIVFCVLLIIISVYLSRVMLRQKNKLQAATRSLEDASKELDALRLLERRFAVFKEDLNQAEMFTKVQKSRAAFSQDPSTHQAPERYQYVHSLHQRGVSAPDIASILTISTHEAKQLVTLAKLSEE